MRNWNRKEAGKLLAEFAFPIDTFQRRPTGFHTLRSPVESASFSTSHEVGENDISTYIQVHLTLGKTIVAILAGFDGVKASDGFPVRVRAVECSVAVRTCFESVLGRGLIPTSFHSHQLISASAVFS